MSMKINFKDLDLQDALDLAILIEKEAEDRYKEFVELLGHRYKNDAGDLFRTMVVNEAKHGQQLSERRKKLFANIPVRVTLDMIWDVEAPAQGLVRSYMSPRQATEVALQSERKAFQFFDEALKYIRNVEVRELFSELRSEELEHEQMLLKHLETLPPSEGQDLNDDDIDEPSQL